MSSTIIRGPSDAKVGPAGSGRAMAMEAEWKVQIFGDKRDKSFEISVVRASNKHGQRSWGWFDENKLLICHNGGPCHDALVPIVWDRMIELAEEVCRHLNSGGTIESWRKPPC